MIVFSNEIYVKLVIMRRSVIILNRPTFIWIIIVNTDDHSEHSVHYDTALLYILTQVSRWLPMMDSSVNAYPDIV